MTAIYRHSDYEAMRLAVMKDPSALGIFADWLEENGAEEFALHVRLGFKIHDSLDDKCRNWSEAFGYAGGADTCADDHRPEPAPPYAEICCAPFDCRDVKTVLASSEGENDGAEWLCVGELWDGRFFSLRAGCDYSGWG